MLRLTKRILWHHSPEPPAKPKIANSRKFHSGIFSSIRRHLLDQSHPLRALIYATLTCCRRWPRREMVRSPQIACCCPPPCWGWCFRQHACYSSLWCVAESSRCFVAIGNTLQMSSAILCAAETQWGSKLIGRDRHDFVEWALLGFRGIRAVYSANKTRCVFRPLQILERRLLYTRVLGFVKVCW